MLRSKKGRSLTLCKTYTVYFSSATKRLGEQVCALLSGRSYAEEVVVTIRQILPIPAGISPKDAAAFSEVARTVWSTVFTMGRLSPGELFMGVQVGLGRLQFHMAKHQGVRVFVTAEIKLSSLLPKRLTVLVSKGAELRPRTKRLLYAEVEKTVWPAIGAGKVKPKLIQVFTVVTSSRSS
ncbi:hypothetical protein Rs2_37983 [Raphanus sativus]|nr:hypothetical protein Rs2_37983 [Raphanus sativus]